MTRVGRTSLTVNVSAFAERERNTYDCVQVADAELTYVAIDASRTPRPVDIEV